MAKGNPFLGTASGSVGDVTLYRKDGEQISRVRVRKIANPRTEKQVYQRAILATVVKAYSAGKMIFDHAFEGARVPEGAYRYFLKRNTDALRARVYNDMQDAVEDPLANPLVGPSSVSPVIGQYLISEGSLQQNFVNITPSSSGDDPTLFAFGNAPAVDETLPAYMSRMGIAPGDIFTIVFFAKASAMAGLTPKTVFGFIRYVAKDVSTVQTAASAAPLSAAFDINASDNISGGALLVGSTLFNTEIDPSESSSIYVEGIGLDRPGISGWVGSIGVIRSRDDSPLRSTSQMVWTLYDDLGGLSWSSVIDAWSVKAELGQSRLVLEGGGNF